MKKCDCSEEIILLENRVVEKLVFNNSNKYFSKANKGYLAARFAATRAELTLPEVSRDYRPFAGFQVCGSLRGLQTPRKCWKPLRLR